MELVKLNDKFQVSKPVQNWDSLVWTERFTTLGDFQIQTGRIEEYMNILPEGTVLSLRESNVAMVVERHTIERKKNTPAKLTVTGRSFEKCLATRAAVQSVSPDTGSEEWTVNTYTPSDAAYFAISQIVIDGILSPLDVFPEDMVQFITPMDFELSGGPVQAFKIPRGTLLAAVQQLLAVENKGDPLTTPPTPPVVPHGIRAIRPNKFGTAIGIEIYTGTDRSDTVRFDATRDQLDDGTYLFSKEGEANVGYGLGQGVAARMFEGDVEPSGFDRKVILVDSSATPGSDNEVLRNEVSKALSEAHETAIFDGSLNQDIHVYKYGVDYQLGDIVRTVGDYGLETKSRLVEYIRSQDNTGEKAFPTLVNVPD